MNDIDQQIKKDERSLDIQRRFDALERKIVEIESKIERSERPNDEIFKRLYFDEQLSETFTSKPDYIPRTFKEQFVFYSSGGEKRLYAYIDGSWVYEIVNTASSLSPSISPSASPT